MITPRDHRRAEMMWARDEIRDDLRVGRIWYRRLEDPDDGGGTDAETDRLTDHRRVAVERRLPEPIGENSRARSTGTIVLLVQQAADHGTQPHHFEERSID